MNWKVEDSSLQGYNIASQGHCFPVFPSNAAPLFSRDEGSTQKYGQNNQCHSQDWKNTCHHIFKSQSAPNKPTHSLCHVTNCVIITSQTNGKSQMP